MPHDQDRLLNLQRLKKLEDRRHTGGGAKRIEDFDSGNGSERFQRKARGLLRTNQRASEDAVGFPSETTDRPPGMLGLLPPNVSQSARRVTRARGFCLTMAEEVKFQERYPLP